MLPAAHVVRGDIAVITGHRDPARTYRRPLIATALDDAFHRMAAAALGALAPGAREILVLHAYRFPFEGSRMLHRRLRLELELEACVRESLARLARSVDTRGVHLELLARRGDTAAVLLAEIAARACDVVVIGTPRRRGAWPCRRTAAEHIIEAATCDIVLVGRAS